MPHYVISKVFQDEKEYERVKGLVSKILNDDLREGIKLLIEKGDDSLYYPASHDTKEINGIIKYNLWICIDNISKVSVKDTIEKLLDSTFIEKEKPHRLYSDD